MQKYYKKVTRVVIEAYEVGERGERGASYEKVEVTDGVDGDGWGWMGMGVGGLESLKCVLVQRT